MKLLMIASLTAVFLFTSGAHGQAVKDQAGKAQTKFEQFQTKDGVLRVTEFYEMPAPDAKFGLIEAKLISSKAVNTNDAAIGLRISYKPAKEHALAAVDFLDDDEISSLLNALDYIARNQKQVITDSKTYTEVKYKSRGGLEVGFSCDPKDKTVEYFASVGGETVFLKDLSGIKQLADAAKHQIDTLNAAK